MKIIVQNTPGWNFKTRLYIPLTNMASRQRGQQRAADVIKLDKAVYTIEFLGTWKSSIILILKWSNSTTLERVPDYIFVLSASEWIERTNAIGIIVKDATAGRTPIRILHLNSVLQSAYL